MESLKKVSFLGRTHQRQTKVKLAKPYHVQDSTSRLSVIVFLHINVFQQRWGDRSGCETPDPDSLQDRPEKPLDIISRPDPKHCRPVIKPGLSPRRGGGRRRDLLGTAGLAVDPHHLWPCTTHAQALVTGEITGRTWSSK